jgi:hypothetical protein
MFISHILFSYGPAAALLFTAFIQDQDKRNSLYLQHALENVIVVLKRKRVRIWHMALTVSTQEPNHLGKVKHIANPNINEMRNGPSEALQVKCQQGSMYKNLLLKKKSELMRTKSTIYHILTSWS